MLKNEKNFSFSVIYKLLSYIGNKSPNIITVMELQKISGYSKRHLTRLFVDYTKKRPSEYIKIIRAYRIYIELKYTTGTYTEICHKYNIKDSHNFKRHFLKLTGNIQSCVNHTDERKLIGGFKPQIKIAKKYLSCSFVSLFDHNTHAKGMRFVFTRSIDDIMKSHFELIEAVKSQFCKEYSINQDELWTCVKFKAYDKTSYEITITPCILNDKYKLPVGSDLSLKGDYLCFSWVGPYEKKGMIYHEEKV